MFNFKGIIYFPLELSIYGTNQTIIYEYNDSSLQKSDDWMQQRGN